MEKYCSRRVTGVMCFHITPVTHTPLPYVQ